MSAAVSAAEAEKYARDGVVVLKGVVDGALLETLARGVEKNLASPGPWANDYTPDGQPGRFFDDYVNWQRISEFGDAALGGVLPRIAAGLLGTRSPRFFHEHVLVKEPGTPTPTPWHHDDPYYGLDAMATVSLWVPLDPAPEAVALRCIVGSHLTGKRFIPNRFVDDTPYVTSAQAGPNGEFEPLTNPDSLYSHPKIESFPAEPGDVVAFHFRTLHSAPGTIHHASRRRVVSFRYVGDDARWGERPWTTSPPLAPQGLTLGGKLDDPRFPLVVLS